MTLMLTISEIVDGKKVSASSREIALQELMMPGTNPGQLIQNELVPLVKQVLGEKES